MPAVGSPAGRAYPGARRLAGATRNETAVRVAEALLDDPRYVGLAVQGGTGFDDDTTFADALAGGAHVGRLGGPMLLTGGAELEETTEGYLEAHTTPILRPYAYGGPAALSDDAVVAAQSAAAG